MTIRKATPEEINEAFEAERARLGRTMEFTEVKALDAELAREIERDYSPESYILVDWLSGSISMLHAFGRMGGVLGTREQILLSALEAALRDYTRDL